MKRPGPLKTKADLDSQETYDLIKKAQDGDSNANDILLKSFRDFIERESLRVKIDNLIDDIDKSEATGAGMRAFDRAVMTYKFDGKATFATYATRCIDNGVQDINRQERIIGENEVGEGIVDEDGVVSSIFDRISDDTQNPESLAECDQILELFWAEVDKYFKPDEREVIKLYLADNKVPKIVAQTNKTQKEINAIIRKFKQLLPKIRENLDK